MPATNTRVSNAIGALALAAGLALTAGAAAAQTMNSNSASFNAGWGRVPDQENQPVQFDTRDANGNQVIVNGQIMKGADQSAFAFSSGVASTSAGAGFGGATAIGNSLNVITQGNYNTVIVDSVQTNNGKVTANANGASSGNGS